MQTTTERPAPRRRQKLVPAGVPFSELSPSQQKALLNLRRLREEMAAEIERAIAFLDSTDGYSNTEIEEDEADPSEALIRCHAPAPAGALEDDEPSLGFQVVGRGCESGGSGDDREGDDADDPRGEEVNEDGDGSPDDEPSLSWTDVETRKGRYCNNGLDLEAEHDGREPDVDIEPSLGWTVDGVIPRRERDHCDHEATSPELSL